MLFEYELVIVDTHGQCCPNTLVLRMFLFVTC